MGDDLTFDAAEDDGLFTDVDRAAAAHPDDQAVRRRLDRLADLADLVYAGEHIDLVLTKGETRLLSEGAHETAGRLARGDEVDTVIDTAGALVRRRTGESRGRGASNGGLTSAGR